MARSMTNKHQRIGHTAVSESKNAKWRVIDDMTTYPAIGQYGQPLIGLTAKGKEGTAVLYLSDSAALEAVKGLLQQLTVRPITMTVDVEFQAILKEVDAAIARENDDARQVVECLKRQMD